MVMETPSPQCIGQEFVRQYYTILHEVPEQLHRFYSHDSCFVHGGVDKPGETTQHVQGQQDIHQKIMSLNFQDCYVKIGQVDSQPTVGSAVVVQVTGELSNNGQPMRRFMQTFVLVSQSPKKYYVHNDIFRYQDEVFADTDTDTEIVDEGPDGEPELVEPGHQVMEPHPPPQSQPTPPQPAPASMYYENTPEQPLSNGTAHMEEPELTPAHKVVEETPAVVPAVPEEEPKETYESQPPMQQEKPAEVERPPSPEPEAHKGSSQPTNMTWAAMLQRNDGGPGPVPQAPPPASKAQLGPAKPPMTEVSKPMENPSGPPQPQRIPRPPRDRGNMRERDGSRHNDGNNEDVMRRSRFSDSQQVFVGNLPHTMSEKDLKDYFERWGKVVDLRINKKSGSPSVPNYGFVVFADEKAVQQVLQNKEHFHLEGEHRGHRINVEEKKQRNNEPGRTGSGTRAGGRGGSMMGRGGMSDMGWGRGGSRGPENRGGPDSNRGGPPRRGGFGSRR